MNFEKLAQSNILETLKLTDAPKKAQDEAVEDAMEIIMESATDRIKDGLSDEALEEFERVFSGDHTESERDAFLKKHVPDFEEILVEESLRYKYLTEIIASSSHE